MPSSTKSMSADPARDVQNLSILLIQARDPGDPALEHELESFASTCRVPIECFETINVPATRPAPSHLSGIDVVFVGGSGEYSIARPNFDHHEPLLAMMKAIVAEELPMFASCFGFQALVKTLGGRLETTEQYAEIGTHDIHLSDAGREDPLFGQLPPVFPAQLGHNDSAVELPDSMIRLASSEVCPVQAIRVAGTSIVATQFHPELTHRDNMKRYIRYLENYADDPNVDREERWRRAEAIHRPSPDSNRLMRLYLEHVVLDEVD